MWETKWKKHPNASVSHSSQTSLYPLIYSLSVSLLRTLSPSLFCSGFIPPLLMDTPHVWLIKNQLKTPRRQVSRATPAEGRIEALPARSLSLSFSQAHIHTLSLSPPLVIFPLVSSTPRLRPPVYWKLGTWFTRSEDVIYIFFFLVHPLIYLLDFSSCLWWRGG